MSVVPLRRPGPTVTGRRRRPGRSVVLFTARQVRRGWLILVALAAGMSAVVVGTYRAVVADQLDAANLRALAGNPAIRMLFGEPVALDSPGGFTVWRTGTPLAVLLSVWALLAATRLTRGDEDAGRLDLLLAGRLTLVELTLRRTATLVAAAMGAGMVVAVALLAAGTALPGALVHGAGLGLTGAFFAVTGSLAAQVLPTRAAATGASAGVLGAALMLRSVGDGLPELEAVRWLSPFGLLSLSRPYADDNVMPLFLLLLGCAGGVVGTAAAARRRDLRGALIGGSAGRRPRTALLGSMTRFAARRLWRVGLGWAVGVGAYFVLVGALSVSLTEFLRDNPRFADLAAQAGFARLHTVEGYLASLFLLLAVPVGVFVAVRFSALAADEGARRLDLLLAAPVTRRRLVAAEIVVTLAAAALLLLVAAAAAWTGASAAGASVALADAVAGTANVLPVVLLCLGASVVALGWTPRAVVAVGSLPAVGGFLLDVIVQSSGLPSWIGQPSPFVHLAAVPEAPVNWTASAVMVVAALVTTAVGAGRYDRRDRLAAAA